MHACEKKFSPLKYLVWSPGSSRNWKVDETPKVISKASRWLTPLEVFSSNAHMLPNRRQLSYQLTYFKYTDVASASVHITLIFLRISFVKNCENEYSVGAKWKMIMRKTQINEHVDLNRLRRKKEFSLRSSLSFNWKTRKVANVFPWCSLCENFLYGENCSLGTRSTHDASFLFYLRQIGSRIFHFP